MIIGHGRHREHPQPTLCITTMKKILEKVTSLPVKHAQWSDTLDPPQIITELCPYTTRVVVLCLELLPFEYV